MLGIFPSRRPQKGSDVASCAAAAASAEGADPSHSCESCLEAPGIPFCRVEWSFLCSGCAAVVHGHNWVIAVSPNPNPNPSSFPYPCPYPYSYPNPSSVPNYVANLCSDGDTEDIRVRKRGRKRGRPVVFDGRIERVMRYREKREIRNFEKKVRYENRKVDAESRPRVEGKFSRSEDDSGQNEEVGMHRNEETRLPDGEEELHREWEMVGDGGML